jgi:hypothetical protein
MSIVIGRAVGPPWGPAFTQRKLCPEHPLPRLLLLALAGLAKSPADVAARFHQPLGVALAFNLAQSSIRRAPRSTAHHKIASIWRHRVLHPEDIVLTTNPSNASSMRLSFAGR